MTWRGASYKGPGHLGMRDKHEEERSGSTLRDAVAGVESAISWTDSSSKPL